MRTTTFAFAVLKVERIRQASWNMAHNDGNRGNITSRRNMRLHQLKWMDDTTYKLRAYIRTEMLLRVLRIPFNGCRLLISYYVRDTRQERANTKKWRKKNAKMRTNAWGRRRRFAWEGELFEARIILFVSQVQCSAARDLLLFSELL